MRRISLWLLSTVAALVLLFSYRTSTMGASQSGPAAIGGTDSSNAGSTSSSDGGGGSAGASGSYDGSVAQTRWGPVQVRITVDKGQITEVTVLAAPDGNMRDRQINAYALPILRDEALQAQSADIDTVSGATVTSIGYRQSLQAAIDAAYR